MNTDIRISVSFKDHRKRKKLRILIGECATDYLIDLWISTAMNHPSGVLANMDELDIALESGWVKDPVFFIDGLMKAGFLNKSEHGVYSLHDWEDHQGYVVHAPERSSKAKAAAEARWKKNNPHANGMDIDARGMDIDTRGMLHASQVDAPTPTPTPTPAPTPLTTPTQGKENLFSSTTYGDTPDGVDPNRSYAMVGEWEEQFDGTFLNHESGELRTKDQMEVDQ